MRLEPALGGALGDRVRDAPPEVTDSAGDSDRPNVDAGWFGLGGGRIEPRFAGCGRGGMTMIDKLSFRTSSSFSVPAVSSSNYTLVRMHQAWVKMLMLS